MRGKLLCISICALLSGCGDSVSSSIQEQKQIIKDTIETKKENTIDSTLNQKDKQGKKQGLWIESDGLKEVYYLNGQKNGIYKSYFKKSGKLEALGEYENDKPRGTWYYFNEASRLVMIEQQIVQNKVIKLNRGDGTLIIPEFTSYYKNYYNNGLLKEEGEVLYNESIEFGNFFRIGIWKYYDETGKLIRVENFKEGKSAE